MKFRATIRDAAVALCFAVCLGGPSAKARGDLGVDRDACVLGTGPYLIYFAGYQPGKSPRKFCEDVPSLGRTVFVFDYAEPELREMKADFRIVQQSRGGEEYENVESATLAYLPPKVYPNGTFSFEYVFTQAGDYVGVVTVDGARGEQWVARFPFSVAVSHFDRTPLYLIGAAAVLGLILFLSRDGRGARWLSRRRASR